MSPLSSDARLLELDFLSRLSRYESIQVLNDRNVPRRDMIVHLLLEEMVNGVAGIKNIAGTTDFKAKLIVQQAEYERLCTLVEFLAGKQVIIRISHKGRVRLAELEQAIKIGREREPFGILFAARYWERDLRIALLSASKESPVTLCFLDMNGLKAINDVHGHEAAMRPSVHSCELWPPMSRSWARRTAMAGTRLSSSFRALMQMLQVG